MLTCNEMLLPRPQVRESINNELISFGQMLSDDHDEDDLDHLLRCLQRGFDERKRELNLTITKLKDKLQTHDEATKQFLDTIRIQQGRIAALNERVAPHQDGLGRGEGARSRKRAVKLFVWEFFLISSGSPHVRPTGRTCGEPDEIELTAMGVELNVPCCRCRRLLQPGELGRVRVRQGGQRRRLV